ncbi:MAG: hypothetical protein GXO74_02065 [Calditrichaeota bacterium]|nr:hypothetical protein [Calditrichota bacterium]
MTSRQRFHETMHFGTPDRVPYLEEGIRKDVIESWYRQGLSRKTDISDLFKIDHSHEVELDCDLLSTLPNRPTSLEELSQLRNHLNSEKLSRFWRKQQKKIRLWQKKDHIIFIRVHRGFFLSMGVHNWGGFTEIISLLLDDPGFVREAMLIQGEFTAKLLDEVLQDIEIDAVIFSEPIAGNEGPLISPTMYEEFILKSYHPILDIANKHGIDTIILRTYANIRKLIPNILKNGFNCLWACETNSIAMDYRDLRKEFGHDLRLIGGIDVDALRYDKATIRQEIEEKVPELIASGGFVPIANGRIRKDISFENYVYYRSLLEQITSNKN